MHKDLLDLFCFITFVTIPHFEQMDRYKAKLYQRFFKVSSHKSQVTSGEVSGLVLPGDGEAAVGAGGLAQS